MKFRNPWIDPRVVKVRPQDARAYLLARGWKELARTNPHMQPFEPPGSEDEAPEALLPLLETGSDYVQRVIELVEDIAQAEDRSAAEVLDDILRSSTPPSPANGSGSQAPAVPTSSR